MTGTQVSRPYRLGVMQGRLLPKYQGRYQAHPIGYWQEEFSKAAEVGLDLIEFIFDFNDYTTNPLYSAAGIAEIRQLTQQTGVGVRSVCADYFMLAPLHECCDRSDHSCRVLEDLMHNCQNLGVKDIVIPCVDSSSLRTERDQECFVSIMREMAPSAEACGLNLSLETDLGPNAFALLLERIASSSVTVNYDIGNSASLGYSPLEELAAYGALISDIHIKDRKRGGSSVKLGTGDADFTDFFRALSKFDYRGPFIMQAYRDDEGVAILREQLAWITPWLERWASGR